MAIAIHDSLVPWLPFLLHNNAAETGMLGLLLSKSMHDGAVRSAYTLQRHIAAYHPNGRTIVHDFHVHTPYCIDTINAAALGLCWQGVSCRQDALEWLWSHATRGNPVCMGLLYERG